MRYSAPAIIVAGLLVSAAIVTVPNYNEANALPPATEVLTILAQKDSFVREGGQTNNEGANPLLDLQSSDKHRPVIRFDQNQIVNAINGRQLQSAILKVYATDNGNNWGSTGNNIAAYRLLSDWEEGNGWNFGNNIHGTGSGVTWGCAIDTDISNNQNNCSNGEWNGGSFQSSATSSALITNSVANQWVSFDVTSDINAFLAGTSNNYGWLIKKNSESLNGDISFASKEASNNRPLLDITVLRPEIVLANEYLDIISNLDQVGAELSQSTVTQGDIDDISANLTRIRQIVVQLQDLGFDGEVTAARSGQEMVGNVRFYSASTSEELFTTQIPHRTLGIFAAMGLSEELSDNGLDLSFDQLAGLLSSSENIAAISNFNDDEVASNFVLASIAAFHPSTGHTILIFGLPIGIIILIAVGACIAIEECVVLILEGGKEILIKTVEFIFPLVTVSGVKFDDKDFSGLRDETAEPGIPNWPIYFSAQQHGFEWKGATTMTNPDGSYYFNEIPVPRVVDTIVISEGSEAGWVPTGPEFIQFAFTPELPDPQPGRPPPVFTREHVLFGNFKLGEITGTKFLDDGDGNKETGEQGLAGWTIVLKNATSGASIANTTTDTNGNYRFSNLARGSYRIEEVQQPDYTLTLPSNGYYVVDIQESGTIASGRDFGNTVAQQVIFEEKFDSGISGWTQTVCQRGSGQTCFISTVTTPTPVPSPPNWGASGILDTTPGTCTSPVSTRHSKTFTVPTAGSYEVKSVMFGSICSGCTVRAQLYIDSLLTLERAGQRLGVTPPQPPVTLSTFVSLTAGQHSIQIGMTSNIACSGTFQGEFDNISITRVSTIQTAQSQSSPPPGGPYYSLELNQTSVNATATDSATIRLLVHWDPGYDPEPVSIDIMSNSTYTGISHTVTSAYNTTTYQAFDITFDISPEVQVGEYQYFIFVNEEDSDDSVAEVVRLNIQ